METHYQYRGNPVVCSKHAFGSQWEFPGECRCGCSCAGSLSLVEAMEVGYESIQETGQTDGRFIVRRVKPCLFRTLYCCMLSRLRTLARNSSTSVIRNEMQDLLTRMNAVWENGLSSKDLVVLHTSTEYITEKNCNVPFAFPRDDCVVCCSCVEGRRIETEGIKHQQ